MWNLDLNLSTFLLNKHDLWQQYFSIHSQKLYPKYMDFYGKGYIT